MWFLVITMIWTSFFVYTRSAPSSGAVFLPLVCFVLHRSMIAMKYATFSDSEMQRFHNPALAHFPDIRLKYHRQGQLITGLMGEDNDALLFEIAAAATRLGFTLPDLTFEISRELDLVQKQLALWEQISSPFINPPVGGGNDLLAPGWGFDGLKSETSFDDRSVLSSNLTLNTEFDAYTVPVEVIAYNLLLMGGNRFKDFSDLSTYFITLMVIFAAITPFLWEVHNILSGGWFVVFYICTTIVTFMYFGVILTFLKVVFFFCVRLAVIGDMLGDMIVKEIDISTNIRAVKSHGSCMGLATGTY